MADDALNYHHLRYFWCVAHDGNLTRTARRLRVSQSALSAQIRLLEDQLGEALFDRLGRGLVLTEAGRIALAGADQVFAAGSALLASLRQGRARSDVLRVGAIATLSRNFLESLLKPLLTEHTVRLRLVSGSADELVAGLADHRLDLVLSNRPAPDADALGLRSRRIARQAVSLVGHPRSDCLRTVADLHDVRMLLPPPESGTRATFDALCALHGVSVRILAEVDDMALLRLLTRDADAVALLPSVVVRDELRAGVLQEHFVVPDLFEDFYALTSKRRFHHPLVAELLARDQDSLLAMSAE